MIPVLGNFNRNERSGPRRDAPRRDFGGNRGGGFGGNRGPAEMHDAVCDSCGKQCQVPFRPNGSKPVYCSDCFKQMGGGQDSGRFQDRAPRRPDFDRQPNFERRSDTRPQGNDQTSEINRKLDQILKILTPAPVKSAPVIMAEPKAEKVVKEDVNVTVFAPKVKAAKKVAATPVVVEE
ncbi:MAG: CxxC-x17-CxxC domain-containing protein [Patescibacteria group bacterium]